MKTKLLLFILFAFSNLYVNAQNSSGNIRRERKTEDDGFVWILTLYKNRDDVAGAENKNGKTIIPLSRGYDFISYYNGLFKFSKNKKEGVCDKNGKEIISISRGYDYVYVLLDNYIEVQKNGKLGACDMKGKEFISPSRGYDEILYYDKDDIIYYSVKKNGKQGVCDLTGKELIAPIYDVVYRSGGEFKYNDSNHHTHTIPINSTLSNASAISSSSSRTSSSSTSTTSRNYSSTTSSSSSSSSSTSRYGKLLKSGTFTFTGVMYGAAGYSSSGQPFLTSFKIYENYLVNEQGNAYPFFGMQTFDGVSSRGYKCNDDCFFYYGTDGVLRQQDFMTVMGLRVGTISIIMPGDVRAAYTSVSSPSGSGSNYSGSSSSGSQRQRKKDCRVCYNTGICQTCNGRGWVDNPYVNRTHPCTACNNEQGNAPNRKKCQACLNK